jgi:hypothetical protein
MAVRRVSVAYITPTMRAWMSASDAVDLCARDSVTVNPVLGWRQLCVVPRPVGAANCQGRLLMR